MTRSSSLILENNIEFNQVSLLSIIGYRTITMIRKAFYFMKNMKDNTHIQVHPDIFDPGKYNLYIKNTHRSVQPVGSNPGKSTIPF